MEIFKFLKINSLKKHLSKNFFSILLGLVFLSYGQILFMQPWQDDNALFFKLAHIEEPAGFLGKGIFGEGPYRFTATPYYVVYKLFGFNTTAYFALALICYFFAALSLYFLFKELVNKFTGQIAALLFATNYVTSDSFIRLFNSVSTSIGVILFCLLFIFYNKFLKTGKSWFYLISLIFFFLLAQINFVRTHFMIGAILGYDLIFSLKFYKRSFKSQTSYIFKFLLRSLPFILVFYYIYNGSDARSGEILNNFFTIFSGKFTNLLSLFSSIGFLVLPDVITFNLPKLVFFIDNPYYRVLTINFVILLIFNMLLLFTFKKSKLTVFFGGLSFIWFFISRYFFKKITTIVPYELLLVEFMGGIVLLGSLALIINAKKSIRKILVLLLGVIVVNILFYVLYDPTVFNISYNNRYLTYSFIGLIGFLAVIATSSYDNKKKIPLFIVSIWGVLNLFFNIHNQNQILINRSFPIQSFYQQLTQSVPNFPKGSVLYFDIQKSEHSQNNYFNAINSSQMPPTTAIAWRYGIDRYDIQLIESFDELYDLLEQNQTPLDKVYTFWYSKNGLVNTTSDFKNLLGNSSAINLNVPILSSSPSIKTSEEGTEILQPDLDILLPKPISSIIPSKLTFELKATPFNAAQLRYPLKKIRARKLYGIDKDLKLRTLAFNYAKNKESFRMSSDITTSSEWQRKFSSHLIDGDPATAWQADRTLWPKEQAWIKIDLKTIKDINKLVWINGYADQSPTSYNTLVSMDGLNWVKVSSISINNQRLDPDEAQIIEFDMSKARFVKLEINDTLNNDAPAISEIWIVGSELSDLDIKEAEGFLKQPFAYIPDQVNYDITLDGLGKKGNLQVLWKSDKSEALLNDHRAKIDLIYDGQFHEYEVVLPAGGTQISDLKLTGFTIPGEVELSNLKVSYQNFKK